MTVNIDWGWKVAEISPEGGEVEFLVRWRVVPKGVRRADWPSMLVITWENRFSTARGFPIQSEFTAMGTFELRLGEAVEKDGLAVMSLAVTGEEQRELVFHTRDVAEFSKRLHEMPQEKQRYPIRIEKSDDPGWTRVDETFARFGIDPSAKRSAWQRLKSLVR